MIIDILTLKLFIILITNYLLGILNLNLFREFGLFPLVLLFVLFVLLLFPTLKLKFPVFVLLLVVVFVVLLFNEKSYLGLYSCVLRFLSNSTPFLNPCKVSLKSNESFLCLNAIIKKLYEKNNKLFSNISYLHHTN